MAMWVWTMYTIHITMQLPATFALKPWKLLASSGRMRRLMHVVRVRAELMCGCLPLHIMLTGLGLGCSVQGQLYVLFL